MSIPRRRGGTVRSLAAFAVGATIGSIVSLLCAPASGQATRKRLGLRLRNMQKETGRRLGRTGRELQRQARQVRIAAREWLDERMRRTNGHRRPVRRAVRHAHAA